MRPKLRMLNIDLPAAPEHYLEHEGGLLVKGVVLLATGTWTDSAVRTPLFYPTKALEQHAGNWEATTYWARHAGGMPRNIVTDRLGEVLNPRYEAEVEGGAIVGDVFYDGLTQASRDGAALAIGRAKAGKPLAVSVEWYGAEAYNKEERRHEAAEMHFVGLAAVDRGACSVCGLPASLEETDQSKEGEEKDMEAEELTKMLADFKAEVLAAVDEKLAAAKPAEEKDEEMGAAIEETKKALAAAEKRIEKLELEPNPKSKLNGERGPVELEAPEGPRTVHQGGIVRRE